MWRKTWLTGGMVADADARWSELLLAAAAGDAEASRRFFVWARTEIEPLCRLLGDPDSIDDLIQETNERIVASMHRFRGDGRPCTGFARSPDGSAPTQSGVGSARVAATADSKVVSSLMCITTWAPPNSTMCSIGLIRIAVMRLC